MRTGEDPEVVARKNREKRDREKRRRWERASEARKEAQMWREIWSAVSAAATAGGPTPRFLVYFEVHGDHRRGWEMFPSREDASELLHELGRDGAWVRTRTL